MTMLFSMDFFLIIRSYFNTLKDRENVSSYISLFFIFYFFCTPENSNFLKNGKIIILV